MKVTSNPLKTSWAGVYWKCGLKQNLLIFKGSKVKSSLETIYVLNINLHELWIVPSLPITGHILDNHECCYHADPTILGAGGG